MTKRTGKHNDNIGEGSIEGTEKEVLETENKGEDEIIDIESSEEEKSEKIKIPFPKIFNAFDKNINDEYMDVPNERANLSEQAEKLLNTRGYYIKGFDRDGNEFFHESKFNEFCRRISRCLASAETLYTKDVESIKIVEYNIHKDIFNKRFTFNSPALFNLGKGLCDKKEKMDDHNLIYHKKLSEMTYEDYEYIYKSKTTKQMLFACFVIGIEDNLESIMDSLKDAALVSKAGGGVGFNFGNTRERNALVFGGVCGKASGPVSWIHMYNEMGNSVVQGGTRRAALMGMLYDDHPDLFEFMHCKDEEGVLSKFNISVAVSNTLMNSIINNKPNDKFKFHSRKDGKEVKRIPTGIYKINSHGEKEMEFMDTDDITCGKVWNDLCEHAWGRGDPGVFFIDTANYDNILKEDKTGTYKFEGTNPCVVGTTEILTDKGYRCISECVGEKINVWNGYEWSEVTPRITGYNKPILNIKFSNGSIIRCTPYHKFKLNNDTVVEAKDLKIDDIIANFEMPNDINLKCDSNKYFTKEIFVTSIEDGGLSDIVYCLTEPKRHMFVANGVCISNCGEQNLPNFTSCNLGSINLNSFLFPNENGTLDFNIRELSDQIIRSIYYLDLIIDASSFPVKKIEERTKAIRPVGLGFMGLADIAYDHELKSKANELEYCKEHFPELEKEYLRVLPVIKNYSSANPAEE